ncbi:hypothetical protein PCK2_000679, partial [Pneumocystis canis]
KNRSSNCINNKHTEYRNYEQLHNKNKDKFKCSFSQNNLKSLKKHSELNKPNFELSGKLAAESNNINNIPLKYYEPIEACKPNKLWQLYSYGSSIEQCFFLSSSSSFLVTSLGIFDLRLFKVNRMHLSPGLMWDHLEKQARFRQKEFG